MSGYSDFGTLCTIAGVTGKVINVDPPTVSNPSLETTNHSSANWRDYIHTGLRAMSPFTLTMEVGAAMVGQISAVQAAGAAVAIVFTEKSMPAWSFSGLLTDFKYNAANASSPAEEIITVTIQPTGALTIAAAASNWYDGVTMLTLDCGGALALTHPTTYQLVIYAIVPGLPPHTVTSAEMANLTIASSVAGKATVSATGLITTVAAGATVISALVTAAPTVETACNLVVS